MLSITRLYPQPKPVQLGTRIFLIGEMRVSDLVAIQAWLDSQWQCPLEALGASLSGVDDSARRKALLGIWDALEAGPPIYGSDEATRLLDTKLGCFMILATVLRHHHPEMDGMQIAALREEITQSQYEDMLEAWKRPDNVRDVADYLGFLSDEQRYGSPIGWPEVVCELCQTYGWTPAQVLDMEVSQIRTLRRGGKPVEYGTPVPPKTNLKETMLARRAQLAAMQGE